MRIAQLVYNLEIGGAQKMVVDLARYFRDHGHSPHVVCLSEAGPVADVLNSDRIEVHALGKRLGFRPATVLALARHFRDQRVDVVHTHNPLTHGYGAVAAALARVPVVVNTVHGLTDPGPPTLRDLLYDTCCLLTDRVVPCCGAVNVYLARHTLFAARRAHVISNGIPLERFTMTSLRPRNGEFTFGAVGRLAPVKDHESLLKAVRRLRDQGIACRLEVLGEGPLRGSLESLAHDLHIDDCVRFLGSSANTPAFLGRIDAFVLSSVTEALPLAVLEAMAAGLPVVATAVGGVPELINGAKCGWLAEPANPESLAGAMRQAVECEDRRLIGLRGRSFAVEHHSASGMAEQYQRLFLSLLDRGRTKTWENSTWSGSFR